MKDIPWEEAKKIVADALQPLGEEYVSLYWKGFDEGWVDVYETVGKRELCLGQADNAVGSTNHSGLSRRDQRAKYCFSAM